MPTSIFRAAAIAAIALSAGFAAPAWAQDKTAARAPATITITVPDAGEVTRIEQSYDCGGTPVAVEYINAGGTSLATLSLKGQFVVASNVIAASGARYAGGPYIWWSKGDGADLYDQLQGEDKPVACKATDKAAPAGK